jgi:hypothetical protein
VQHTKIIFETRLVQFITTFGRINQLGLEQNKKIKHKYEHKQLINFDGAWVHVVHGAQ